MMTKVRMLITSNVGIITRTLCTKYVSIHPLPAEHGVVSGRVPSSFFIVRRKAARRQYVYPTCAHKRELAPLPRPPRLPVEPEKIRSIHPEKAARIPVIDAFLRHVAKVLGDDNRLQNGADDPDGELLFNMRFQHLPPDRGFFIVIRRYQLLLLELKEMLRFRHVDGFAGFAFGFVILFPFRPLRS